MDSVIVTGATSMLGIATIKRCIEHGIRVLAIIRPNGSRKSRLPSSELLNVVECDLSNLDSVQNIEEKYDCLYHFGWCFTDRETRDNPELQSKNIQYTLDAVMLAYRMGCKTFIGAGSQAEYGRCNELVSESSSTNPEVCYGIAKFAAGRLAEKLCVKNNISCIWARVFSVYGVNDSDNVMVSYALRQYINKETASFSNGMQLWDYLFEDDAGMYFYLLGMADIESCVVNIGSGDCRKLRDYIYDMADALGNDFKYQFASEQVDNVLSLHPDCRKLRELINYEPAVAFKKGIEIIKEHIGHNLVQDIP